mmetsp:Transcript_39903/g.93664  ORF Transcript_39903/g.93664 Transcript_39903/m.93664 type:complete len:118 (-) Transcript_39903:1148-1501(-)
MQPSMFQDIYEGSLCVFPGYGNLVYFLQLTQCIQQRSVWERKPTFSLPVIDDLCSFSDTMGRLVEFIDLFSKNFRWRYSERNDLGAILEDFSTMRINFCHRYWIIKPKPSSCDSNFL